MKKAEIKVGGIYTARVAGRFTTVRVDSIGENYFDRTVYSVTNQTTGRKLTFRSAAKLRSEVKQCSDPTQGCRSKSSEEMAEACQAETSLYDNSMTKPLPSSAREVSCLELPQPSEVELEHDPDLEESDTGNDDGVPVDVVKVLVKEEGEQGLPFARGTQATPTKSPTTGGTATPAAPSLFHSETSGTAQPAAPSTQSNAGFAGVISEAMPPPSGRRLTDQQRLVVERAPQNHITVIEAGAGCGKTSTLVELASNMPGIGQYTAFNTSLVDESRQKFSQRTRCNTIHSLAFGSEGKRHAHKFGGPRIRASEVAAMLGLQDLTIEGPDGKPKRLVAGILASQVMRGLRNFCQSADAEVAMQHLPRLVGIDKAGSKAVSDMVKTHLLPFAQAMWAGKCDPKGAMPFSHDDYVKIWSLNDPRIAADYILLDEAQDTSPVMLSIMEAQVRRGTRVVLVGDSNQQIYSWRGAINALASFPDAPRLMLSQSFRFGPVVAEVANSVLRELSERTKLVMRGFDQIRSRLAALNDPDCVLCRTNAGAVATLLDGISKGKKVHLVKAGDDVVSFIRAARDLKQGRTTSHPELCCFSTWYEVVEFSKTYEGEDVRLMVKLIEKFGADKILGALENMPSEREADLVICTAHKSKGREWRRVKLASDFPPLDRMDDEAVRLLYVAATRAQEVLDLESCPPFLKSSEYVDDEGRTVGGSSYSVDIEAARRMSERTILGTTTNKVMAVQDADTMLSSPSIAEQSKKLYDWSVNTWTKGRKGDWLVRGKPGQTGTVAVSKSDGSTCQVLIKKQIWANDEAALYEVVS